MTVREGGMDRIK